MAKQHKYNVGDEITVKIAAVTENDGKTSYRIKGIENIKFSEGGIDAAAIKKPKPGDIVYEVILCPDEEIVYLGAMVIEDISTKEIKIAGDWFESDDDDFIFDREEAEKRTKEYSEKYNFRIEREGLLKEEVDYGKTD